MVPVPLAMSVLFGLRKVMFPVWVSISRFTLACSGMVPPLLTMLSIVMEFVACNNNKMVVVCASSAPVDTWSIGVSAVKMLIVGRFRSWSPEPATPSMIVRLVGSMRKVPFCPSVAVVSTFPLIQICFFALTSTKPPFPLSPPLASSVACGANTVLPCERM